MTAERHNTPQHNLLTNQARNGTSNARSGLSWRQLMRFLVSTVLASFVVNEIWEMAQMSAYVETAGYSWTSTLGRCTQAAVGDVGIILGIYAAGALVSGDPGWGLRGRWYRYTTTAILGLAFAVLVEHAALATGRWSYTERMPMVSWLGAGLWPLLQMTLLFTHVLVCPVVGSQHKERTFMMNHADGWMGGWAGGGMLLWAVLAVLVVVVVLIKSLIRK